VGKEKNLRNVDDNELQSKGDFIREKSARNAEREFFVYGISTHALAGIKSSPRRE
jgi:hypothetical protein